MPKKVSAKKAPLVKSETSSSIKPLKGPKKAVSEIDEIFANGKKRKLDKYIEVTEVDKMKKTKKKKIMKEKGKIRVEEKRGSEVPRKKTGDGFKLYTEDELGIGNENSGGTRLCPFDCDCCF